MYKPLIEQTAEFMFGSGPGWDSGIGAPMIWVRGVASLIQNAAPEEYEQVRKLQMAHFKGFFPGLPLRKLP